MKMKLRSLKFKKWNRN